MYKKFVSEINSKVYWPHTFPKLLVESDGPEKIIQDFKILILQMDINTPDEVNNKLADITKRVRKLYAAGRDD